MNLFKYKINFKNFVEFNSRCDFATIILFFFSGMPSIFIIFPIIFNSLS